MGNLKKKEGKADNSLSSIAKSHRKYHVLWSFITTQFLANCVVHFSEKCLLNDIKQKVEKGGLKICVLFGLSWTCYNR